MIGATVPTQRNLIQRSVILHSSHRQQSARPTRGMRHSVITASGQNENAMESFINKLTVAIQSSPMAEGKKRLAMMQAGNYDKTQIRTMVNDYINGNPVMIFSFSTCPFCNNAKKLLSDKGVAFTAVELNQVPDGMAMRAELADMTGRTSMPNIWIGGEGIGGCNDGPGIMTLEREGKLDAMLQKAGAM